MISGTAHHRRELYLVRHAKSSWKNQHMSDFDRPLNDRGAREANFLANYFRSNPTPMDLAICSPAKRTLSTAETILAQLPRNCEIRVEPMAYGASAEDLLGLIATIPAIVANVMVVGHNPAITVLATYLSTPESRPTLPYSFAPATLAILRFESPNWNLSEACASNTTIVEARS